MTRMTRPSTLPLVAALLTSGLAIGCSPPRTAGLSAEREAAIADTLLSLTEAYNEVWEELDLERISEYHAADFTYYRRGVVQSASQPSPHPGRRTIQHRRLPGSTPGTQTLNQLPLHLAGRKGE